MASNKHYEIDLLSIKVRETEPPKLDELLRLADLPNSPNPFGNTLKRGRSINDRGDKWLLDEQIRDFNYQRDGYSNEVFQFKLSFSFDCPLEYSDLQTDKSLYSIARHISQSRWRNHRQGVGSFFQLGDIGHGSIRGDILAGFLAVGTFVVNYPALKAGFYEILTDAQFISEQISTGIRAAKLPAQGEDRKIPDVPNMASHEEQRRQDRLK